MSLVAREKPTNVQYEPPGDVVKDSDCFYWAAVLFFFGTAQPAHETVVKRILDEHHADMLVDAKLTTSFYGVPYVFWMTCANVEGRPTKMVRVAAS